MYDFEKLVSGMLALGGALGVGLCVVRFLRGRRGFQVLVPFWHYVCESARVVVRACVCVRACTHTQHEDSEIETEGKSERERASERARERERRE
jgi:hypothetical protein